MAAPGSGPPPLHIAVVAGVTALVFAVVWMGFRRSGSGDSPPAEAPPSSVTVVSTSPGPEIPQPAPATTRAPVAPTGPVDARCGAAPATDADGTPVGAATYLASHTREAYLGPLRVSRCAPARRVSDELCWFTWCRVEGFAGGPREVRYWIGAGGAVLRMGLARHGE